MNFPLSDVQPYRCLFTARLLRGGHIPTAIAAAAHRHVLFTMALFGLSQKMKWFSAQQKLSPRGLSYLCHVKPSGLSL